MKNENYVVILSSMVKELRLKGNDLLIFALIHGFTQDGNQSFTGSSKYIQEWTGLNKSSIYLILKKLTEKGLLQKKERFENGVKFCEYKSLLKSGGNINIFINKYLSKSNEKVSLKKAKKHIKDMNKSKPNWEEAKNHICNMKYSEFLDTIYWKSIAAIKRKESSFKCAICNSKKELNIHHRTYENHGMELQNMNDLICICNECHEKFHNIKR